MTTNGMCTDKDRIGKILNDTSKPLKERFRALFTLRNLGGEDSIDIIAQGFRDSSALLKHELAYCLGQMQDTYAIPVLLNVLEDRSQEAMVRHEAGKQCCRCFEKRGEFALKFLKLFIYPIEIHFDI